MIWCVLGVPSRRTGHRLRRDFATCRTQLCAIKMRANVAYWHIADVQRCPIELPLSARKPTFVPHCQVVGRLLPLHPGEQTRR